MIIRAYAIYDNKARVYSHPFFTNTDETAQRIFTTMASDGQSNISKFPSDFELFFVGDYDDATATLTAYPKQNFGLASNFKEI